MVQKYISLHLDDLIILSKFIKNYIKNSNFNEALTNKTSETTNLNIEPKTFYFRTIEIGKFLNPVKL